MIKVSSLDVKLGLRMFAKHPGLSLVAVCGMAIAIAFGAGYFALVGNFVDAPVPIEGGDRLVMVRNYYLPGPEAARIGKSGDADPGVFDFVQWRDESKSIAELSAFQDDKRNLITEDGQVQLVRIAAITASGLRMTRVAPLLGRVLLDEDERTGALPVVVLGYEEWQRRFNGDPSVLGRTVRLANTPHTIVGVMPEGFAFPIFHRAWVPLRLSEFPATPGAGPSLTVFGRIAEGYSLAQARAELEAIGERLAAAFPQSHASCPSAGLELRAGVPRDRHARYADRDPGGAVRRCLPAPHRRRECRGSCLCAHRHTFWRDHRQNRARRHARPRRHAAVRRSARAVAELLRLWA